MQVFLNEPVRDLTVETEVTPSWLLPDSLSVTQGLTAIKTGRW